MPDNIFRIAIDGPVAAGKGTVARLVATRLNFLYVDTGAMYRTVALIGLEKNIPLTDETKLVELIDQSKIEMRNPLPEEKDGRLITVLLNGEDVSWKIRTEQISANVSTVAALEKVRKALVKQQQQIASNQSVVMEGRDITFRVLPEAELKIYLTASDIVRAKRRFMELEIRGEDVEFDQVYQQLLQRDNTDMNREVDPLHIEPDAWVLDTTDLRIDQVVDLICARVNMLKETQSS
jgi:CMP/dCMP kinase